MKITKLGHCCLLVELKGKRIVTDPGSYTVPVHSLLQNIDAILFTHEHQDHFHIDSLKTLLEQNPNAVVFANNSVSDLLEKETIPHTKISHSQSFTLGDISLLGIGEKHAMMHSSIPLSSNLGFFFVDEKFWYPGDAFTNPERGIEILALPVSGPWMKVSEAVDYAILLKPKKAFPVHDGTRFGSAHTLPAKILSEHSIDFIPMIEGSVQDF